jgi:hypothetical protein
MPAKLVAKAKRAFKIYPIPLLPAAKRCHGHGFG